MRTSGLRAKIIRVFALQVLLIGLATLLGIFLTNSIVQDVLMRSALEGEAEHYWRLYRDNPSQPLPNTDNMVGYMATDGDDSAVPEAVANIGEEVGYHRASFRGQEQIVHVSDNGNARLYLVFASDSVTDLALFFGIIPLSIVLLLVYGFMLFAYRMSQRAISPIVQLSNYLDELEFGDDGVQVLELAPLRKQADSEVAAMIEALDHFTARVNAFIERERLFTRDASHELRTPVAVFKGSLDLLEKTTERPEADRRALDRMRRTVNEMEDLIETLLLMATEQRPSSESVEINDIVRHLIDTLHPLAQQSNNTLALKEEAALVVHAPRPIVQMLLTNLIRNAIAYTSNGTIEVVVTGYSVVIHDDGIGMSGEELERAFDPFFRAPHAREKVNGHGLGLAIVQRLADEYGWSISATSEPGHGTRFAIAFLS